MAGGLGFDGHETMLLPPLDLAVMAATLRNSGETVEVIDADPLGLDGQGVYQRVAGQNWNVIIGTASLPTLNHDAAFLAGLRKFHPLAKIIGKTLVRDHAVLQSFLQKSGADFVIHGEADLNILQLLHGHSRSGTAWLERQGLSHAPVFHFDAGEPVQDLDNLPFAARDLLPNSRYSYPLLGSPVATLQTSRGCPYPCGYYCPYPLVEGVKWRAQSPQRIFNELQDIIETVGLRKVYFRDATFTLNQRRIHQLCDLIIDANWSFEWVCETRVDCLSDDLLDKMKAAGCIGLLVGVETGDEQIMHDKEGKKGLTIPKLTRLREKTFQLGIRLHFLLIVGLPKETRESLVSTYDLMFQHQPDTVGITIITPYPGTPLYEEGVREGWVDSFQWENYGGHQVVMHTPHLTREDLVVGKRFLEEGFTLLHKQRTSSFAPELAALSVQHYDDLLRWAYELDEPVARIQECAIAARVEDAYSVGEEPSGGSIGIATPNSSMSSPLISVIIPTFNRRAILRKTLLGMASQTLPPEQFEVIVIDDGSSDDTMEMLQKWKAPFQLRAFTQSHGGPNVARNFGLQQAKSWIVLLTGDDMIPGPSFLESHLKFHLSHKEPVQAMIGFIDWSPEIPVTPFMRFITSPEGGHQFSFHLAKEGKVDFRLFYTSNLSLKREFISLEPGPFDTDFTYPAYDDIELGYRLTNRGMQLHFQSQAVTYHHHEITLPAFVERQKSAGRMAWILDRKQPDIKQFLPLTELSEPNVPDSEELRKLLELVLELEKPDPQKLGLFRSQGEAFDQVYARTILYPVYSKLLYSAQCFGAREATKSGGMLHADTPNTREESSGSLTKLSPTQEGKGVSTGRRFFSQSSSMASQGSSQLSKVIAIPNDPICGKIRLVNPLGACRDRLWLEGQVVGEGEVGRDGLTLPTGQGIIWLLQRTSRFEERFVRDALMKGTRIVHDLDDLLWEIPEDNVNKKVIGPGLVAHLMKLLRVAECVTVSTEPLQQALETLGIQSTILPNCLVADEWIGLKPQRGVGRRPRIGWAGQAGVHRQDIAIMTYLIEALGDEVEWVFLGEAPQHARQPGKSWELHSMVDLVNFPRALANLHLDLALAPLAPSKFNEAKSDLRLLQYGILGYPVIATDIFPHQHAPVTRVPNEAKAWLQAIREHIYNAEAADAKGKELRQWVLDNRLLEQWAPCYRAAWLGRAGQKKSGSLSDGHPIVLSSSSSLYQPSLKTAFECSIIIPVFNKVELTRQCLIHLAEVTDGCSYEVIVVDNNSTDGTKELLANLGGDIQVISNPENFGFAKACNQGAAAAKGRNFVFLNNDTIPKPGWLQALVDEVETHQDVAVVGSKLLYPDETIQHAGVVFSKNCLTPYHIFNGAPGDLHAANVRREFQAVTAACFLIRRKDFEAIGGFDEAFRNGFEDVDLCLKIRERGRKVVYQPKSVLYHLEHQTPGRKDPEAERHNGNLLMSRWASKIVVDEDLYTVPEGYANRYYFRDGWLRQSLEPFQSDEEKTQWNRVQRVQELLLSWRYATTQGLKGQDDRELHTLLSDDLEWPEDSEVLRWAAKLCNSLQLFDGERAFWKRTLSFGEDRETREQLAKLALNVKDLSEAAHHVQALLRSDPNNGSGYWFQGILLMQSQQCAEAARSFRRAIQYGYDARKAGIGLGMACMGMGDVEEAWKIFEQVGSDHPDDAEAMNGLIQSGTSLQRWEGLGQWLSRYVERNPADCDMRFALAGVEFRAGRMASAKQQFEMLSLLKPDYEGLTDLKVLLQPAPVDTHAFAT
jgi:GT2 family glycosyltransferase/radical SAM superfamily enzyme YgiQ (UPF0313 family)/thioredoxin-like negative regulator of GroEL